MSDENDDPTEGAGEIGGLRRQIENTGVMQTFAGDRDAMIAEGLLESQLPDTLDAFVARDPFSADYIDVIKDRRADRVRTSTVDDKLRQNLLEHPHLMEKPDEAAFRGAAAVFRALRDQLRDETVTVMDRSSHEELLLLQSELDTRREVISTVLKGMGDLGKRLEQRLAEGPDADGTDPQG